MSVLAEQMSDTFTVLLSLLSYSIRQYMLGERSRNSSLNIANVYGLVRPGIKSR